MVQLKPVASSQIKAIGFDPLNDEIYVEFRRKTPGRSVYRYQGADAALCARLLFADSVGTAFGSTLKKDPERWPFVRLTDEEAALASEAEEPTWLPLVEAARESAS
jgi:hypothetical protein